jgi:endonuclease-3
MRKQERADKLREYVGERYADAKCSLDFKNPFELLVATVLSAQCTDERVNIVTKDLFAKYPDVFKMADADIEELMQDVKSTGFYKNKAKSLKGLSIKLIEDHGGEVPPVLDELVKLPGVGRKTANVVLGNCFDQPGITVDTHVKRITNRVGLVNMEDPVKIEFALMKLIPNELHTKWCHQVILFGREICNARKPKCDMCGITEYCKFFKIEEKKK